MERWEIRPAPNSDDPQRHLLLLRGGAADVAAVLKTFGALCGRPTPLDGEQFNLSFVLHKVTPEARAKLDSWFGKMSAPPAASVSEEVPTESSSDEALFANVVEVEKEPAAPPLPPPAEPEAPAKKEPLISLGPEAVTASPAAAAVILAPAEPSGKQALLAARAGAVSSALCDELRADWTFETFLVGAYNRFAHAAAMSVVSSPGSMYNPLFLYGAPGVGKSHILHAIANSLSKGLGCGSLLVTSGARLSRAVSTACAGGFMAAIDRKTADSKAIFIDDMHLLALTDQNRDLLAKLFKSFFDRSLQVVITSICPPKALGALEEALKFTFSKGWSVDLKIPSPNVQRDLISSVNDRAGAELSGEEIGQLADRLTVWGYQDLTVWIRRLAVLRGMRAAAGQPAPLMDLLRLIYEPITIGSEAPPVSTSGASFTPPAASAGSQALAILVPEGQDGLLAYAANLFHDVGRKNGFTRAYSHVLLETYDAMQPVGVPFQISDMCHRAGATRALIIGPGPGSPLASRANEFSHAVRHILDSSGTATGFIAHAQLHLAAHYVNAHLDFEK